jgi:hypothetical protein
MPLAPEVRTMRVTSVTTWVFAAALSVLLLAWPGEAYATQLALQNCFMGTTLTPTGVVVIYWNSTSSDPSSEATFDVDFLASAFSTYSSPGLAGTTWLNTVTQYYSASGGTAWNGPELQYTVYVPGE